MNSKMKHLVRRLMDDVKCDKWFGNPFRYLVDNWETRGPSGGRMGKPVVEAACDTFDTPHLSKEEISDLRIAYDVWIDMNVIQLEGRHDKCDLEVEDLYKCIEAVQILRTVKSDMSERDIKNAYYGEFNKLTESDEHGPGMDKCHAGVWAIEHMLKTAREVQSQHEQALAELDNLRIKEDDNG